MKDLTTLEPKMANRLYKDGTRVQRGSKRGREETDDDTIIKDLDFELAQRPYMWVCILFLLFWLQPFLFLFLTPMQLNLELG